MRPQYSFSEIFVIVVSIELAIYTLPLVGPSISPLGRLAYGRFQTNKPDCWPDEEVASYHAESKHGCTLHSTMGSKEMGLGIGLEVQCPNSCYLLSNYTKRKPAALCCKSAPAVKITASHLLAERHEVTGNTPVMWPVVCGDVELTTKNHTNHQ